MKQRRSIIGCVRYHWLIWSCLLFFNSIFGQAAEINRQLNINFLYTDSYAVMPGDSFEMTLNIFLEDLARGFQFDIFMPSEFSLDFSGVTEDPVLAPFSVSSSDLGSGNYRFVVFSLGSDVLPVGDYPVFYLPITVSASAAAGISDFPLDNVTISGMNNQNIATPASIIGQVEIVGNSPPVAQNQSVTMSEDSQLDIILIATDPEGDPLTYTIVTQPTNGTAVLTGNTVDYTPDANYNGPDSFTFKANDGTTDSNVATVSIDVTAVNDAPVASDQSVTTDEDTMIQITLEATDVDGDPLTYVIVTQPTNGTAVLTGNTVDYTPDANYNGPDSFTFTANDGTTDSNVATVSIDVLLDLDDFKARVFSARPNPFISTVEVDIVQEGSLVIYDLNGQIIKNIPHCTVGKTLILLENSSSSVFFIKFKSEHYSEVIKLIKH